jgi:hypothetical protein
MKDSAIFFRQLTTPFRLLFQRVKELDGLHYLSDINTCTKIEILAGEFTDISELSGFQHLENLTIGQLPLNGFDIVDPSPLTSLVNLKELVLRMTRIRDLQFLANFGKLKKLMVGQTLVADLSPISGIASVEDLDIRGTRVKNLQPLSNYQNLKSLMIGADQIASLDNLRNLKNLARLSIIIETDTGVDLQEVGRLTQLKSLWIWSGASPLNIQAIGDLTSLDDLTIIGLGLTKRFAVDHVDAIGNLPTLRKLTLGSLIIGDLSFLVNLRDLEELNLHQLPVTSLEPLAKLSLLKTLSMIDINVADVSPLLELPNLATFRYIRVPARTDVLTELARRGVKVDAR